MMKFFKIFMVVLLIAGCSEKEDKAQNNLVVKTGGGEVAYAVENAVTPEQLEKGLMFRDELGEKTGMIFDLSGVQYVAMWMKNTKIPLDFIFIDEHGVVVDIFENAVPYSEEIILPKAPGTVAVLEVNAGDVKKHGIKIGDVVVHQFFAEDYEAQEAPQASFSDGAENVSIEATDGVIEENKAIIEDINMYEKAVDEGVRAQAVEEGVETSIENVTEPEVINEDDQLIVIDETVGE